MPPRLGFGHIGDVLAFLRLDATGLILAHAHILAPVAGFVNRIIPLVIVAIYASTIESWSMANPIVKIDCRQIRDWGSFHEVFSAAMGFPDFYGRNMDAWIDCLTYIDEPGDAMTSVHAPPGGILVIQLDFVGDFAARCPELYAAIIECASFVNWRRIEMGKGPVLALSFWKSEP
jgi:Barstar (barnase inhibitor)